MTEEQIKQKAEAEADKVIIGSGMDRASVIHLKHLLVTMYIQGATKVTKELEKENAELKEELTKKADTNHSLVEQMADLESENAELKEINEKLRYDFGEGYIQDEKEFWEKTSYLEEQLTKAKEIIKMLHSDCYSIAECEDTNLGLWEDDLAKAEQFLKETE